MRNLKSRNPTEVFIYAVLLQCSDPLLVPSFRRRRATIRIDEDAGLPTRGAILANAEGLAQYAAISQAAGLTPIVEPEILIEGTHSPELFAEVKTAVLNFSSARVATK